MYFSRTLIALSMVSAAAAMPALYERQVTTSATPSSSVTVAASSITASASSAISSSSSAPPVSSSTVPPPPPPPTPRGREIHPNGNRSKCLDVRGNSQQNGTPVQIYDCNGTGAQKWVINRANTKVRLAGTNFCLDAGSSPGNGIGMKIWQCYDNLPAQAFYYTDDKRIAVTGKGQCLDLTDGDLTNARQSQTWRCTDNNNNQVWTL
ncbi:hypothetical protein HGRIS_000842 [Hohenbuehelia grisea]|uniref:Ricin B lectin domain-containing protein n=1 Tax=Hohenbuehelia grisea TaxID=104357 RepID=A0ABR3IQ20_9AGAR